MKQVKVVDIRRKARRGHDERTNPGIVGKIRIVHKIDFNPRKMLKRLMDCWI
ncbi:hypothetical protein WMF30_51825 [Sorangium sp. So ce134]